LPIFAITFDRSLYKTQPTVRHVASLGFVLGLPPRQSFDLYSPLAFRPSAQFGPSGNPEAMAWNQYLLSSHTQHTLTNQLCLSLALSFAPFPTTFTHTLTHSRSRSWSCSACVCIIYL